MGRKNDLELLNKRPILPKESKLSEIINDSPFDLIVGVDGTENKFKTLIKTDIGRAVIIITNGVEITNIGSGDNKKRIAYDFSKAFNFKVGDSLIFQIELAPATLPSVFHYDVQVTDTTIVQIIQGLINELTLNGSTTRYILSIFENSLVMQGVNAFDDFLGRESRFEKTVSTAFSFNKALPFGDVPVTNLSHLGAYQVGAIGTGVYVETIKIGHDSQLTTQQFLNRRYKLIIDTVLVCDFQVLASHITPDYERTIGTIIGNIIGQLDASFGLIINYSSAYFSGILGEYKIERTNVTPWLVQAFEDNFSQIGIVDYNELSTGAGSGDMTKSVYDQNGNGMVDTAEKIDGIIGAANDTFYGKVGNIPGFYPSGGSLLPELSTKDQALGFAVVGGGNNLPFLTDGNPITAANFISNGAFYSLTIDTQPFILKYFQILSSDNNIEGIKISGSGDAWVTSEVLWDDSLETFVPGNIRLPSRGTKPYDSYRLDFTTAISGIDLFISTFAMFTSEKIYLGATNGDANLALVDWSNGFITQHKDVEKPINPTIGNNIFGVFNVEGTITNPTGALNNNLLDPAILGPANSIGTYSTESQMINSIHFGKTNIPVAKGIYTILNKSQYRVDYDNELEALITSTNFFYQTIGGSPILVNPVPIKKLNNSFSGGYGIGVRKSVTFKVSTTIDTTSFNITNADGKLIFSGVDDHIIVNVTSPSGINNYSRKMQNFGGPLLNRPGGPQLSWLGNNLLERYGTIISKVDGDIIEVGEYIVEVLYMNANSSSSFYEMYLQIEGGGVIYDALEVAPPTFVSDPIQDVFEIRTPSGSLPFFKTFDIFTLTIPSEIGQTYTYSPSADGISLENFFIEFATAINSGTAGGVIPSVAIVSANPDFLKIEAGRIAISITDNVVLIGTSLDINTSIISIPNPFPTDLSVNQEISTFLDLKNPLRKKVTPFFTSLESDKTRSLRNFHSINDMEKGIISPTKTDVQLIASQIIGTPGQSLTHEVYVTIKLQPSVNSVGFFITDGSFNPISLTDFNNVAISLKMKTTSGEKEILLTEEILRGQFNDVTGLNSLFSDSYDSDFTIFIRPLSIGEFSYPEIRLGELTYNMISNDGYIFFKNNINIVSGDLLIYELSAESKKYTFALNPNDTQSTNLFNFVNSINAGTAGSPPPIATVFFAPDPFLLGFSGIGVDFSAAGWNLKQVNAALIRMSINKPLSSVLLIASEFPVTISQFLINSSVARVEGITLEPSNSDGNPVKSFIVDSGGFLGNASFLCSGSLTSSFFRITFEHNLSSINSEINAISIFENLKVLSVADYPEPYNNVDPTYKFSEINAHKLPFVDKSVNKYGSVGTALDDTIDRLAITELNASSNESRVKNLESKVPLNTSQILTNTNDIAAMGGGNYIKLVSVNGDYDVLITDRVVLTNGINGTGGGGAAQIHLPSPFIFTASASPIITIKLIGATGACSIIPALNPITEKIEGLNNIILNIQNSAITFATDGSHWYVISRT